MVGLSGLASKRKLLLRRLSQNLSKNGSPASIKLKIKTAGVRKKPQKYLSLLKLTSGGDATRPLKNLKSLRTRRKLLLLHGVLEHMVTPIGLAIATMPMLVTVMMPTDVNAMTPTREVATMPGPRMAVNPLGSA